MLVLVVLPLWASKFTVIQMEEENTMWQNSVGVLETTTYSTFGFKVLDCTVPDHYLNKRVQKCKKASQQRGYP